MAQYDVFETPIPALRRTFPFVVVLQSGLIEGGRDRVVPPLVPPLARAPSLAGRLAPIVRLDAHPDTPDAASEHLVLVLGLTNLPAADLKRRAGNLAAHHDAIVNALDLLFHGY